jgi:hypothetical protein
MPKHVKRGDVDWDGTKPELLPVTAIPEITDLDYDNDGNYMPAYNEEGRYIHYNLGDPRYLGCEHPDEGDLFSWPDGIFEIGQRPVLSLSSRPKPARLTDAEEEQFWNARKKLRLIREWARARSTGPWAVLGEVLCGVVCRTPPTLVLPPIVGGDGTLNMLLAVTGRSGLGKGSAASAARAAMDFTETPELRPGREPLGSGEGLARTFGYTHKNPDGSGGIELVRTAYTAIVAITEIDNYAALSNRNGSTLSPQLRQLYSGEELGFGYAGADKRVIIPAGTYRACVIAGVQPGRGAVILEDADSGFAQRWLWLPAGDPHAPDTAPAPPARIAWSLPESIRGLDLEGGETAEISVCGAAWDEIRAARLRMLREEAGGDDLRSHWHYTRLKVAAALALLDGRLSVTDSDWELSSYVMKRSDATRDATQRTLRERGVEANRALGRAEGIRAVAAAATVRTYDMKRIGRNVLSKIGREWISQSDLSSKGVASRDRAALPEVLDQLVAAGKIERGETTYHGQSGFRYRRVR